MMQCYIICDNDGTMFVVIGTREQADAKLQKLKEECRRHCIRYYGEKQGPREFERHYWHLHDNVPYEVNGS